MFVGSGTNIKMFDFMAAGLPIVTTPTSARVASRRRRLRVRRGARDEFADDRAPRPRPTMHIAASIGAGRPTRGRETLLVGAPVAGPRAACCTATERRSARPRPAVSVIVPTYERHARARRAHRVPVARRPSRLRGDRRRSERAPVEMRDDTARSISSTCTPTSAARRTPATPAHSMPAATCSRSPTTTARPDADWLEAGLQLLQGCRRRRRRRAGRAPIARTTSATVRSPTSASRASAS